MEMLEERLCALEADLLRLGEQLRHGDATLGATTWSDTTAVVRAAGEVLARYGY